MKNILLGLREILGGEGTHRSPESKRGHPKIPKELCPQLRAGGVEMKVG